MEKLVLGIVLLIFSVQDIKNKTINIMLIIPVIPFVAADIIRYIAEGNISGLLSLAAGTAAGVILIILSVVSAEQVGMGDAIVLCIAGAVIGFWKTVGMLFTGMFLAALFSLAGIVIKKLCRKTKIPLMPFLFIGYLITVSG